MCIRPGVIATRPDALQSSKRFQFSFADTDWKDSLHPFGLQDNTLRTQSLMKKLRVDNLQSSGL